MSKHIIYIGDPAEPLFTFDGLSAQIEALEGVSMVDLIGDELSIDKLTPTVRYRWLVRQRLEPTDSAGLLSSDGYILYGAWNANPAEVPYGTPVWHYVDGAPRGKYYVDHVERVGRESWLIDAMSVVGLLAQYKHRGGVYEGQTIMEQLQGFFGGEVGEAEGGLVPLRGGLVDCVVEAELAAVTTHGLLPVDWARDNLHKLCMAYLINMRELPSGEIYFGYLRPSDDPPVIPEDRLYVEGSVEYEQPVTDVELTEYTYVFDDNAEAVEVYNNTASPHIEGEGLIEFNTPIVPETLYTSEPGMVVRDANEVSAYVKGTGIIYAVPYQVQSRVISRSVEGAVIRKSKSVSELTLCGPLNSTALMDKLFDYYTTRRVVRATVRVEDEAAGDIYGFTNAFGEADSGFIRSMSWSAGGVTRADCEIVTDYVPRGSSTNLNNVVLLTGTGSWEVPEGIKLRDNPFIRAILIGGGQGGHGGYSGADSAQRPQEPGEGGLPGEGGEGGKVLIVELDVRLLDTIAYSCGIGGVGGESDKAGSVGTPTTFGGYSSADGAVMPGGVLDPINGRFYARPGKPGVPGAKGGMAAFSDAASPSNEDLAKYGESGADVEHLGKLYKGGPGGRTIFAENNGATGWAFGSGGGGAAVGTNGGEGMDGYVEWGAVIGGFGGTGASASIPGTEATVIGCGGNGGNGGGGGGAPGASGFYGGSAPVGLIGRGGKGSRGGRGAIGGIIILY